MQDLYKILSRMIKLVAEEVTNLFHDILENIIS